MINHLFHCLCTFARRFISAERRATPRSAVHPPRRPRSATPVARILVPAVAVFIHGCAVTTTNSNAQSNYAGHPTRIFVATNLAPLGNGFSDEFERLFVQGVRNCGGDAEFSRYKASEIVSPLALEPPKGASGSAEERERAMRAFLPDAVVSIRLATFVFGGGHIEGDVTTDVYDVKLKKIVWKGESNVGSGALVPATIKARSFYGSIAKRLQADGVLPMCKPEANAVKG